MLRKITLLTVIGMLVGAAQAAPIDYATNIALQANGGTALMGHSETSTTGAQPRAQTGNPGRINDGDLGSREQTHFGFNDDNSDRDPWHPYDYAGVSWATAQNDVAAVKITFAAFNDGGWFATPADNDSAYDGTDSGADDIAFYPQVQYSTDGGATWASVSNQSDDYAALAANITTGFAVSNGPATFTFDPVSGINALRLIGDGWGPSGTGNSGDPNGFIGVYEFEAYAAVPEPASILTGALALVFLAGRRRRV